MTRPKPWRNQPPATITLAGVPVPRDMVQWLEEREQRQHGMQQHGDTFAVDSDEPTDTSGIERTPEDSEFHDA